MRKVSLKRKRAEKDAARDDNESDGVESTQENGDVSNDGDEPMADGGEADHAADEDGDGDGDEAAVNGDHEEEPVAAVVPVKVPAKKPRRKRGGRKAARKPKIPKLPLPQTIIHNDEDDEEEEEEDDIEYEVEAIADHKTEDGELMYCIKWKGYAHSLNTWEKESSLNCPAIIAKYNKLLAQNGTAGPSKAPKKKRPAPKKAAAKRGKKQKVSTDDEEDDEKEWEVEKILDMSIVSSGNHFLVHWKGFSKKHDSWEPEENLNCGDLIDTFKKDCDQPAPSTSRDMRANPSPVRRYVEVVRKPGKRASRRRPNRERVVYYDAEESD